MIVSPEEHKKYQRRLTPEQKQYDAYHTSNVYGLHDISEDEKLKREFEQERKDWRSENKTKQKG